MSQFDPAASAPAQRPIVTEEEATTMRDLFSRMIDTAMAYSKLTPQVEALQTKVDFMIQQAERYQSQVNGLTEALDQSRAERNRLDEELRQTRIVHEASERELVQVKDAFDRQSHTIDSLREELAHTRKDRDDYGLRLMEAEDKLKATKQKLDDIEDMAAKAFGLVRPAPVDPPVMEQPKPYEAPAISPMPSAASDAPAAYHQEPWPATPEPQRDTGNETPGFLKKDPIPF